jgi:hypothetical protein
MRPRASIGTPVPRRQVRPRNAIGANGKIKGRTSQKRIKQTLLPAPAIDPASVQPSTGQPPTESAPIVPTQPRIKRRSRVALIVETSLASGREVLQGITRYLREQRGWSVFHEPRSLVESVPSWLKNWDGDGIIARISSPKVADAIVNTGLPVVDVLGMAPEAGLPLVHLDDPAVAQVAARSLLDLRLRHFGFCGIAGANWSDRRALAFDQTVQ